MFKMVNRYGNVYKTVKSIREKEQLERQGYKQVEPKNSENKLTNVKRTNNKNKTAIQNNEKGENG